MLGDIDLNLEPKGMDLILCKPNRQKIGNISDIINPVYTAKFNDIDELSFSIPYNIFDNEFKLTKNPFWDYIKGDYLVLLNEEKYFVINLPESQLNDGKDIKNVKCYSYEYVLNDKKIRGYKTTAMLYDSTEHKTGVLNKLEEQTSWKVGYVDPLALMDTNGSHYRYRTFDISEQTWLSFLNDVQKAFSCIFKYDTVNKKIDIYATENIGVDTGLYISDSNYLISFQKEEKFEDIVTQLNIYGKDNISINNVNPLGTSYREDFSYYMNNRYMTEGLKIALIKYNELLELHKNDFSNYLTQLTTLQSNMNTKELEISALKEQLNVIENNIYVAINAGSQTVETLDLSTLHKQKTSKESEIANKKNEIDNIQSQIDVINSNITTLQNLISKSNNFTSEQLDELDFYIKQDTWQNDNISDVNELYIEGGKALNKINQPTIEYSNIGVADFLKVVEYQHDWNKLKLGDFVTINYEKFGDDLKLRLVEYQHDFDNNKLTLSLSNKDIKDDALRYLGDVFSNNTQTSTAVIMNKYIWDLSQTTNQQVSDIINNNLNAAKNAVLSGVTQDVVIDGHGIKLSNMDNKNEQLRLLSNVIAFSEDGFAHANTAICSKGIVGENIFSKVIGSEKLLITNSAGKFFVDGNKMTAIDMILSLTTTNGNGKIFIDPTTGIKIQNNDVDTLYMDIDGDLNLYNSYIKLDNGINVIKIDPDVGIKITDNNGIDVFYADTNGSLVLRNIKIMGELNGITSTFIDSTGIRTNALKGLVINFDNGASLDTNSPAVRLRWTDEDYIYISESYFAYYQNGSILFEANSNGAYIKGSKLATQSYVNNAISDAISSMPSGV